VRVSHPEVEAGERQAMGAKREEVEVALSTIVLAGVEKKPVDKNEEGGLQKVGAGGLQKVGAEEPHKVDAGELQKVGAEEPQKKSEGANRRE
jgi:hypothetical protein